MAKPIKVIICLFFLAAIFSRANSARVLDEVAAQTQFQSSNPAATALPSGQFPAVGPTAAENHEAEAPADVAAPDDDVATPAAIVAAPAATAASATVAHEPTLSFFMHDILGGSHPSVRVVTGIVANSEVSPIPFSKPNDNLFPIQGGTPLLTGNVNNIKAINNLINNPNNVPFLAGLTGSQTSTIIPNTGNNNNVLNNQNQPFVTAGQLPTGSLQRLMFGTITVIDDELTEGHELGSAVIGRAQGFYLASSIDGTSQTIALTVLLHGGEHNNHEIEDTISFFGVHRTATPESQVAVVGGTGKYENARGYATVGTIHHEDQHMTDGVDTILNFDVFLTDY
ncbi:hypothetical protein SLEP1_g37568 [Rubroshorea leprosula]|uniref:Dirigent protein n=1 Tax=Rubroshorea leprosula TaxID=152421 RepID=A0AAV5KV95_9ROSI|nr:hypothetical protein SLEP1_g37568 [Rubroshorea leprosula]